MKLIRIPKERYEDYRFNVMFDCYKWDPQFLDNNTIAKYALVISKEEHEELERLTEKIDYIQQNYVNETDLEKIYNELTIKFIESHIGGCYEN